LAERERRLGIIAYYREEYQTAVDKYKAALQHDPDSLDALNEMAWLRATCHDARFRDGYRAVVLSRGAIEVATRTGQLDWYYFGTAAAAYAEHGDFDAAVRLQKESIARTPDTDIKKARQRLTLYRHHRPLHGRPNHL